MIKPKSWRPSLICADALWHVRQWILYQTSILRSVIWILSVIYSTQLTELVVMFRIIVQNNT